MTVSAGRVAVDAEPEHGGIEVRVPAADAPPNGRELLRNVPSPAGPTTFGQASGQAAEDRTDGDSSDSIEPSAVELSALAPT